MRTNMPFKIYTKKQVHVISDPRHCVPSEISTAMRDGTETRSTVVYTTGDTVLDISTGCVVVFMASKNAA